MLVAAGRREEALAAYQKSLGIREKLVAADQGNTQWQTELVVSLYKIAGFGEGRDANLNRSLEILRRLDAAGALSADQTGWITAIEEALRQTKSQRRARRGGHSSRCEENDHCSDVRVHWALSSLHFGH